MSDPGSTDSGRPIRRPEADVQRSLSKMHIRFRVVERWASPLTLFVSDNYPDAERFCWVYEGHGELQIEKVWLRKKADATP